MLIRAGEILKNKFKFHIVFFSIVIGLSILGMLLGAWLVEIEKRHPLYFENSLLLTILLVFVAIIITTLIHEISHLITFLSMGFKIRLVVISFVWFYKKNGKWKMKFEGNGSIGLGGLVLPVIPIIKTQTEFYNVKKKYAVGILVAPIITSIVGICSFVLAFFCSGQILPSNQSTFFTICFAMFLFAVYYNFTFVININGLLGDYVSYKWITNNDLFAINQLIEYTIQFEDGIEICKNDNLNKILEDNYSEKNMENSMLISVIDKILYASLAYEINVSEVVKRYVDYYINNIDIINNKIKFETYALFFFHFILYVFEIDKLKAINIWEKYKGSLINNDVNKYHITQIESRLYRYDNDQYLSIIKNMRVSSLDYILNNLDGYCEYEIRINKKIVTQRISQKNIDCLD